MVGIQPRFLTNGTNPDGRTVLMFKTGLHAHRPRHYYPEIMSACGRLGGELVTFGEFRAKKKSRMACQVCWRREVFA